MVVNQKFFKRNCHICNKELTNSYFYQSQLTKIIKQNRPCISCSSKIKQIIHKEKYSKSLDILNKSQNGENNPFFGKHHSDEFKNRLREKRTGKSIHTKNSLSLLKIASTGDKNPMYGKKVFDLWVEKFGIDIANQKNKEWKEKLSKANIGKNNPMYGKETPHKAGKGIGGYYNNFHFRSLHELHYILFLEENKISFTSAEKANLKIPYVNYDGSERTYVTDFLVGNKLIEIKPIKLVNTPLVQLKSEAAKKFCLLNNLIYELVALDVKDINFDLIKQKFTEGSIKFHKVPEWV